ncbi:DNA topoisomerase-3 [Oceanospirillum multiglobuliferum]|uniref:DNA topoisomerase 3 n=1 Tax=Oceanospirillum multiglobuliferum TaxID=64969 RepID=A0A1T4QQQ4_9GAMM|nr:DNA topoisomerase III [Oceanospirillum multiglobuliferum]OPX56485.1 DNA topoisomerase III [Oceanospirillum multiglobuliferum]SKA05811.1 DNA topoisomerase-3 [Oceanospirillum multiglobuliferum]
MKLYIAEKPSLGRAIAAVLPKPHKKQEGYIELGNGDCVSWCIGHLLELADPEAYDPELKKWRFDKLPIIPESWQLQAKSQTRKQLTVLKGLIKQADQLVHAGDPDREGQLLVDEVIDYLKVPASKKQQMQRVLINDLNPEAVRKALAKSRSNRDFIPLATSALARSRADWLYGINLTRAFTLKGQQAGYQGVLSVGRVQTPVLGLVVRRDQQIAAFQPKPFYEVQAHISLTADQPQIVFQAQWQPSEACQPYMDEEGRVLNLKLAQHVAQRISQKPAVVKNTEQQTKQEAPPLPFNLSQLQIAANNRFGFSAQQVLDLCQALYEQHHLITYPRSDSRHLPKAQLADAGAVLEAIRQNLTDLAAGVAQADQRLVSKAWDDSKVDAHHAIIPTAKSANIGRLSDPEAKLYQLIARQYVAQFYPAYRYQSQQVLFEIDGGSFISKARQNLQLGWKTLFEQNPEEQHHPAVKEGEQLFCQRGVLIDKLTQPPKPFTDATLLAAMTGIARYVQDKAIKKVLKETDGLGTEATRASIIELLCKRNFLQRQGKQILSTAAGQALIQNLPESTTLPDMTAHWESQLEQICDKKLKYQDFMQPLQQLLGQLIQQAQHSEMQGLQGLGSKKTFKKRKSSTRSHSTAPRRVKRASPAQSSRNKSSHSAN